MVRRRQRERSLFEVLLPDGHKLWPDWLRRIDTLLEDEAVIEVVAQALEARWPQSRRRGRPGTPAEVVIRMLILKHLFDWSYDDLEQEVRANLVYRAFTRIDAGEVPDAKTILKIAGALGPDVIAQLHRQVVEVAKRAGVTRGRRFRIDTTVVETNVHYPTDSTLLQDGVRVLTRTMQRASTALGDQPGRIRNRLRSVTRRVLTIGYQARSPKTRDALVAELSKADGHDARGGAGRGHDGPSARPTAAHGDRGHGARSCSAPSSSCSRCGRSSTRVVAQTRARLLGGDTHVPDKVLSVFEPHTDDDSQGQDREAERVREPGHDSRSRNIRSSRPTRSTPGGRRTSRCGRRPWTDIRRSSAARPYLAAGDRGFSSAANEQAAARPRRATRDLAAARAEICRAARATNAKRWFRRGQRWRVGCEGRISVIKRRHGLRRCRYHGTDGMASMGRARGHRRQPDQHRDLRECAGGRVTNADESNDDVAATHREDLPERPLASKVISSPESS